MQTDCVILGGGAGGLCAAAALGRRRLHVTVVERLPRVGKKLLATGNGRCNLSNLDMQAAHYGKAAPFVEQMYAVTPPSEVAAFFSSLGLMTAVEDDRVYPRTMAASAVLDVLRMACERTSVTLLTDTEAVALTPSRRGGWSGAAGRRFGSFRPARHRRNGWKRRAVDGHGRRRAHGSCNRSATKSRRSIPRWFSSNASIPRSKG